MSGHSFQLHVKLYEPADPARGSISLGIETPVLVGSLTLLNRGSVTALAIHKLSKREIIIDDRPLSSSEDLNALLDRYFSTFVRLENEPVEKWAFSLPPNWRVGDP